ncbi:MAG: tryptophan--tRNA ligase, partial [Rhodoferax sp.]
SYDNTIPLFAPREQLKKLIAGIKTDSRAPGEPKDTEGSALFQIYQAFASDEEAQALRAAYASGIAWGDAKQVLFERIDREIAPMREAYEDLIRNPAKIEAILLAGAAKARQRATPFMAELRHAVGLRKLGDQTKATAPKSTKAALPSFKQYREADGQFHFKLVDAQGRLLLQSLGFESPRQAAQTIGLLQKEGASALPGLASQLQALDVDRADVAAALAQLAAGG